MAEPRKVRRYGNRSIAISALVLSLLFWRPCNVIAADTNKCVAADGSVSYTDSQCDASARSQQVMPPPAEPSGRAKPTGTSLSPQAVAAAQQQSRLEAVAMNCSTGKFNLWIKAQGQLLPDPEVRKAKLIEISNACRRPLGLSDMIDRTPKTKPEPVLKGAGGAAAAAALKDLVRSGSVEHLQKYLAQPGVNINDRPGTDEALLDYAAELNQAAVAKYLLEHGASPDAYQTEGLDHGLTALHRAAIANSAEVAQLLLARGAEVNFHGPLGATPLIMAASNGSARTAEILLDHGADVSVPTGRSETALSLATANNHPDIVRMILQHVPIPTTQSMNAVAARGDLEALRLMLLHDDLAHDVSAASKNRALRYVIVGGVNLTDARTQMVGLLIDHGADINNQVDNAPSTPVILTTSPQMLEFLIAHGADLKAPLTRGNIVNAIACNRLVADPVGMLNVLLMHDITITAAPDHGRVALACATRQSRPALGAFLTAHGVSPDSADKTR